MWAKIKCRERQDAGSRNQIFTFQLSTVHAGYSARGGATKKFALQALNISDVTLEGAACGVLFAQTGGGN